VRYHACWIENVSHQGPTNDENSDTPTPTASISEEASDPFAINFDDASRRDQSRSASFPRIRFANEEDSDDEESDSDSDDSSTESDSSEETAADPSDLRERGRSQGARSGAMPIHAHTGHGGHVGPSGSATGTTTDDEAVRSILYIQMEFVEKVNSEMCGWVSS
jgi:translation initiation factor 2-alpha kinase 4